MLLFLFLFGLALGAESPSGEPGLGTMSPSGDHEMKLQRGQCPPFWFTFNGDCYKYVSTHLTWAEAEVNCVSEKANLVSIHSEGEQEFVKSLIKNFDHGKGFTWIGLSDTHKEAAWMWSDGSAVDFIFWNSEQPNNAEGNEDCVHTNYDTGRKWNDHRCSETFPSICVSRKTCS